MASPSRIERLDDRRVADYRNVRDADLRGGGGHTRRDEPANKLFMAESPMILRRLLASPYAPRIKSLFLSDEILRDFEADLCRLPSSAEVFVADEALMREIAGYRHHHGALAAVRRPGGDDLSIDRMLNSLAHRDAFGLVAVESVTNVDNIGAVFRNAAAFGADAVVLDPACADPFFRKAIRVSMGHVFHVPLAMSRDWPGDLERIKNECGASLVGIETAAGARRLRDMPCDDRVVFVFGSERRGLSDEALSMCDSVCEIPMVGGVDSLNVAVASAVALYEWRRGERAGAP